MLTHEVKNGSTIAIAHNRYICRSGAPSPVNAPSVQKSPYTYGPGQSKSAFKNRTYSKTLSTKECVSIIDGLKRIYFQKVRPACSTCTSVCQPFEGDSGGLSRADACLPACKPRSIHIGKACVCMHMQRLLLHPNPGSWPGFWSTGTSPLARHAGAGGLVRCMQQLAAGFIRKPFCRVQ